MRTEKLPNWGPERPIVKTNAIATDTGALRGLFRDELSDICWVEKELTLLLSKLADSAASEELADVLLDDLSMSFTHLNRLEDLFQLMQEQLRYSSCDTMIQLIADAEKVISSGKPGLIRDAAIFTIAKRIRYYQITSYGIICSFLRTLGEIEQLPLMELSLEEERAAYRNLVHSSAALLNG